MLSDSFKAYVNQVIKYRYTTIFLVLLATVFLASNLMDLKIDMDQNTWIPQSHEYVQATKKLEEVFGGRNVLIVSVVPKSGDIYQPEVLAIVDDLQRKIEAMPEAIRHNILSIAAKKVKDIRGNGDELVVERVMETVPRTEQEMAALKARIDNNPIYINSLVSPDGKAAAIIADFKIDPAKPTYTVIKNKLDDIVAGYDSDLVDIYMAGLPVDFAWFEHHMMKMPLFFGAAMLLIMIIQYISFRSFQGMILPIVTAILSVLWSLGFMGLIGVHMDGMNTTTPILIMAVAAGHAIQILKRYYEEYEKLHRNSTYHGMNARDISRLAIVESIARVGPVMFIAGLIAAISFFTLATYKVSVVKHFGVFAGAGIISILILEMTFVPALRALLPPPKMKSLETQKEDGVLTRALAYLAEKISGGQAVYVIAISLAVLGVISLGAIRLEIDNSLKNYSEPSSIVRIHDSAINERFGGTNTIYFLVEGPEGALKEPAVLNGIAKLQEFLNQQEEVGKTQSIADLVKRINYSMNGDSDAYLSIPGTRDLIAQYLFLYSLSGSPQDFDSYVNSDYSSAAIWVFLKTDSTNYVKSIDNQVSNIIETHFPADVTVRMGGSLPQTIAGNDALTVGKLKNVAQMAIVVFVLSTLILKSFVGGIFVTLPLLVVVTANFGIMGWFGVPLDMGTMTTAAMAIGIGADYELYLLFRFREEISRTGDLRQATHNSLTTSGKAIIYVALSIAAGYSLLLTSGFAFYSRLGIMVMATMFVSAFTAIIFLRAMTVIFRPRFMFVDYKQPISERVAQA